MLIPILHVMSCFQPDPGCPDPGNNYTKGHREGCIAAAWYAREIGSADGAACEDASDFLDFGATPSEECVELLDNPYNGCPDSCYEGWMDGYESCYHVAYELAWGDAYAAASCG